MDIKLYSIYVIICCAGLLDYLKVDVYGDRLSLKSIGSVSVRDSKMLVVSPFDPQVNQIIRLLTSRNCCV